MIKLNKITGFDWDDVNTQKSEEKHNVNPPEVEQVFFNDPLLLLHDVKHSTHEARYHAYGKTDDGRKLHIAFTLRADDTLIRVLLASSCNIETIILLSESSVTKFFELRF